MFSTIQNYFPLCIKPDIQSAKKIQHPMHKGISNARKSKPACSSKDCLGVNIRKIQRDLPACPIQESKTHDSVMKSK